MAGAMHSEVDQGLIASAGMALERRAVEHLQTATVGVDDLLGVEF